MDTWLHRQINTKCNTKFLHLFKVLIINAEVGQTCCYFRLVGILLSIVFIYEAYEKLPRRKFTTLWSRKYVPTYRSKPASDQPALVSCYCNTTSSTTRRLSSVWCWTTISDAAPSQEILVIQTWCKCSQTAIEIPKEGEFFGGFAKSYTSRSPYRSRFRGPKPLIRKAERCNGHVTPQYFNLPYRWRRSYRLIQILIRICCFTKLNMRNFIV